jgi:hypothetical protein
MPGYENVLHCIVHMYLTTTAKYTDNLSSKLFYSDFPDGPMSGRTPRENRGENEVNTYSLGLPNGRIQQFWYAQYLP